MFGSEAVDYPSEASFRYSTEALITNNRLRKKGFPKTNTLAYYKQLWIANVKSVVTGWDLGKGSYPYTQTLDYARKAFQGQTLKILM